MPAALSKLRQYLPRRRRRLWRYVSGRRHSVGLSLFVLLVLVACGYWYLFNDDRVQDQVVRYLEQLTGGRVKIERAHFSLFGDIGVRNLRVYLGREIEVPCFEGPLVNLVHRPSSLLLRRRVEPTEIVCVNPLVTLVRDRKTGSWNTQPLFPLAAGRGQGGALMSPPIIRLRQGKLVVAELEDGQRMEVAESPLTVTLLPDAGGRVYQLTFEEQSGPQTVLSGSGKIDMVTGETQISGWLGLAGLDRTLTGRYHDWLQRYKRAGRVEWTGAARLLAASAGAGGPSGRLTANLVDVTMQLPPEEGGLKMTGVGGTLVFANDGIEVHNLTGQIAGAPGAVFTLQGRYEGYDADSPFRLGLNVANLQLPLRPELLETLGEKFASWHDQMKPAGPLSIQAVRWRQAGGPVHLEVEAHLAGLSLRLPGWPVLVEEVTGQLRLRDEVLELVGVRGRYGRSALELSGQFDGLVEEGREFSLVSPDRWNCDLMVVIRNLPFTDQVRQTLPRPLGAAWDELSPRGQASFAARIRRPRQGEVQVSVTADLGGSASIEFAGFPYRLEGLTGEMAIGPDGAEIRSVRGTAGPLVCTLNGRINRLGEKGDFEVTVEATDMPLDEKLARALWGDVRRAYESCGLSGRADVTRAVFRQKDGGRVELDMQVALKDAGVCHRLFPYRLERASGMLRVTRDEVTIERLLGRHGQSAITVSGTMPVLEPLKGADLTVSATELSLDSHLREALPEESRPAWDLLEPSGLADVSLTMGRRAAPATAPARGGGEAKLPYRLVIRPRDVRLCYRHFPCPLRRVSGTATIEPGMVILEGLTGLVGSSRLTLDGRIATGSGSEWADLRLNTEPLALDKEMLAAMPAGLVSGLGLRQGGTAALALDRLRFWRPGGEAPWLAPASAPAAGTGTTSRPAGPPAPGSLPASQPAPALAWEWSGRINLQDAAVDLGVGASGLSGSIQGQMGCSGPPETFRTSSEVALSGLSLGPRRLSNVSGWLQKTDQSPWLRVSDLAGQMCGGKVAGFAEVRLSPPTRYGLSLKMENIDLAEFLNAGRPQAQRLDVQGLLTGNLQVTGAAGDDASRMASGKLSITRAKIYKLPVLLGLLNVISLELPGDSAFSAAEADYYLRGNDLVFREIYLHGAALGVLGSGRLDLKTEKLDLTFLTGPPRKMPRIDAISEMLQAVAAEIATVRVTGTLSRPKMQTVPLHSLDATLKELLSPQSR